MAAMRLNIPTVFVSGGPMEGGTAVLTDGTTRSRLNLVTAVADTVSDADIDLIEEAACPTRGSCLLERHGSVVVAVRGQV